MPFLFRVLMVYRVQILLRDHKYDVLDCVLQQIKKISPSDGVLLHPVGIFYVINK